MPGYMVDAESMARLAKMLLAYESGNLASIGVAGGEQESGNSAPIVHPVRVTSSTPDAYGTYPGKLLRYYPGTNTYYDHSNIRIRDVNGEVPSVKRFLGRLGGYTSGNEVLYLIQITAAAGSESGSVGSSSGSGSGSEYYSVSGSESGSVSGSVESGSVSGSVESGSAVSGSVSGSVESGSVSGSVESGSISGSVESGSVESGSVVSGSVVSGSVESGSISGSLESGSVSGSVESGSISGAISGSEYGPVSGESGSTPCNTSGVLTIEVVTDVQCVNGSIVVTKTTIAIPGGVIC